LRDVLSSNDGEGEGEGASTGLACTLAGDSEAWEVVPPEGLLLVLFSRRKAASAAACRGIVGESSSRLDVPEVDAVGVGGSCCACGFTVGDGAGGTGVGFAGSGP